MLGKLAVVMLGAVATRAVAAPVAINFIDIAVVDSPLLHNGQTVKLTTATIKEALGAALAMKGFRLVGEDLRSRVTVTILQYNSGSYIGFSKIARMRVGYALVEPSGATVSWEGECEATAKFDFQSTEKRNADAVRACLADLSASMADKIAAIG